MYDQLLISYLSLINQKTPCSALFNFIIMIFTVFRTMASRVVNYSAWGVSVNHARLLFFLLLHVFMYLTTFKSYLTAQNKYHETWNFSTVVVISTFVRMSFIDLRIKALRKPSCSHNVLYTRSSLWPVPIQQLDVFFIDGGKVKDNL